MTLLWLAMACTPAPPAPACGGTAWWVEAPDGNTAAAGVAATTAGPVAALSTVGGFTLTDTLGATASVQVHGRDDSAIVALDWDGRLRWTSAVSGTDLEIAEYIVSNGERVVVQGINGDQSEVTVGGVPLPGSATGEDWLAVLDSHGTLLWGARGEPLPLTASSAKGVAMSPGGSVAFTAEVISATASQYAWEPGVFGPSAQSWVSAFTPDGTWRWTVGVDGDVRAIAMDDQHVYAISGAATGHLLGIGGPAPAAAVAGRTLVAFNLETGGVSWLRGFVDGSPSEVAVGEDGNVHTSGLADPSPGHPVEHVQVVGGPRPASFPATDHQVIHAVLDTEGELLLGFAFDGFAFASGVQADGSTLAAISTAPDGASAMGLGGLYDPPDPVVEQDWTWVLASYSRYGFECGWSLSTASTLEAKFNGFAFAPDGGLVAVGTWHEDSVFAAGTADERRLDGHLNGSAFVTRLEPAAR